MISIRRVHPFPVLDRDGCSSPGQINNPLDLIFVNKIRDSRSRQIDWNAVNEQE